VNVVSNFPAYMTPAPVAPHDPVSQAKADHEFTGQLRSLMLSLDSGNEDQSSGSAEQKKSDEPLAPSVAVAFFAAMLPGANPGAFGLPSAGDESGMAPVNAGPEDAAPFTFDTAFTDVPVNAPRAANCVSDPAAELAFALRLADRMPLEIPAVSPAGRPLLSTVEPAPKSPAPAAPLDTKPAESGGSMLQDGGAREESSPASKPERARAERQTVTLAEQKPSLHPGAAPAQENRTSPAPSTQTGSPIPAAVASQPPVAAGRPEPVSAPKQVAAEQSSMTPTRPDRPSEVTEVTMTVPSSRADASDQQRIAIRMIQRGSEIHVSVRTPDRDAAQAMRQDLNRLAASLEDAGFHSETWRPAAGHVAAPSQSHTQREFSRDTAQRDTAGDGQRFGGNGGRGTGGQKRRQQDDRPRWVAELEQQRNR
jgi:hypothetical protein